jgi:hypothetical protein
VVEKNRQAFWYILFRYSVTRAHREIGENRQRPAVYPRRCSSSEAGNAREDPVRERPAIGQSNRLLGRERNK